MTDLQGPEKAVCMLREREREGEGERERERERERGGMMEEESTVKSRLLESNFTD